MMSIQRTIDVPVDTDSGIPSIEALKRQAAEKTASRKIKGKKPFEGLYGILKDSSAFEGDPVELVKAWRREWDVH